jgi:hypothetical protein
MAALEGSAVLKLVFKLVHLGAWERSHHIPRGWRQIQLEFNALLALAAAMRENTSPRLSTRTLTPLVFDI